MQCSGVMKATPLYERHFMWFGGIPTMGTPCPLVVSDLGLIDSSCFSLPTLPLHLPLSPQCMAGWQPFPLSSAGVSLHVSVEVAALLLAAQEGVIAGLMALASTVGDYEEHMRVRHTAVRASTREGT